MPSLAVDGVNLRCENHGGGPTVVLIHGSGADTRAWGELPVVLARGRRVVTYDRCGAGRSPSHRRTTANMWPTPSR
jgi:pimeloyl-ACP methyl ester carboxylesterase